MGAPHFLDRLSPSLRERLLASSRHASYRPGQTIFSAADTGAAIVQSGLVRIVEDLPEGGSFTHRHVLAGGVVGLSALVGVAGTVSAGAVGNVRLIWLAPTTIRELHSAPGFALAVAEELLARLADTTTEARLRLRGNLARRLALELLDLAAEFGDGSPVALRLTHEAIADSVGTSREVITRVLREMARSQLVIQDGRGRLVLPDLNRLVAFGRLGG